MGNYKMAHPDLVKKQVYKEKKIGTTAQNVKQKSDAQSDGEAQCHTSTSNVSVTVEKDMEATKNTMDA